ncbi:hypothetical protein OURE66S_03340 [Oligella ureolytica]
MGLEPIGYRFERINASEQDKLANFTLKLLCFRGKSIATTRLFQLRGWDQFAAAVFPLFFFKMAPSVTPDKKSGGYSGVISGGRFGGMMIGTSLVRSSLLS